MWIASVYIVRPDSNLKRFNPVFFLNDVCQIANLPQLFVMGKRLPNEFVCEYFWDFMH